MILCPTHLTTYRWYLPHQAWLLEEYGACWHDPGYAAQARADLSGAHLRGADLRGATLPDGRRWEVYTADHLAGLCGSQEVRARALAAWGTHEWGVCPMSLAHGWGGLDDVPDDLRLRVAAWVALYDGGLLQRPEVKP